MDTTAVPLKQADRLHFDRRAYTFTIRTDTILGSNFTSNISTPLSLVYRQQGAASKHMAVYWKVLNLIREDAIIHH